MSKKIILFSFFAVMSWGLYSQRPALELTFTAVNNGVNVRLDSIKVMNRINYNESMIYWPDTSISLEVNPGDLLLYVGYATISTVGVQEERDWNSNFEVRQNHPNPMGDNSEISMYIPQNGKVNLIITDVQGKVIYNIYRQFDRGHHYFRFFPGDCNFYFLKVQWNGISRSIKMIAMNNNGKNFRLDYIGGKADEIFFKASPQVNNLVVSQSGILDTPEKDTAYTFQFATNIPCPGTPTIEYEGQIYNTIQINSQCWLKENLNVGEMINGTLVSSNNGIIEKYCYDNSTSNCNTYGGLYRWDEMMQYTTQQGVQGICPPGWHLPTDEEWKVLEGSVDSQFGIGSYMWDYEGSKGEDVGTNLKTTSGWVGNGNGTDLFGFSGLPGGSHPPGPPIDYFWGEGTLGSWWTSTESDIDRAWEHYIYDWQPVVYRQRQVKSYSVSVRCLRD